MSGARGTLERYVSRAWTPSEVERLVRMAREGRRPAFIAAALGRKYSAVISKAAQLRIGGIDLPYWNGTGAIWVSRA